MARFQPQFHRPTRRFVEFGDQVAVAIADIEPTFKGFGKRQTSDMATHIGHHHITRAAHLDIIGRVLGPTYRSRGPCQGLCKRKLVGFVERHPAIARHIRRTTHTRDQIVRKK